MLHMMDESRVTIIDCSEPDDNTNSEPHDDWLYGAAVNGTHQPLRSWEKRAESCMKRNVPFLLLNACEEWEIRKEALKQQQENEGTSYEGMLTPEQTLRVFQRWNEDGSLELPVVHCDTSGGYGLQQDRETLTLHEYIRRVQESCSSPHRKKMYGKDWHWVQELLAQQKEKLDESPSFPYAVPRIFSDDWINFFLDGIGPRVFSTLLSGEELNGELIQEILRECSTQRDSNRRTGDYRFCYLGERGSWTPIHHDVLCSYSWSSNIIGYKLWFLFPPSETVKLVRSDARESVPLVSQADTCDLGDRNGHYVDILPYYSNIVDTVIPVDELLEILTENARKSNLVSELLESKSSKSLPLKLMFQREDSRWIANELGDVCMFAVLQAPGETLYVPSHWYHQVINISNPGEKRPSMVLSINHNWYNGYALPKVWKFLHREFAEVSRTLYDCRQDESIFLENDKEYLILCEGVMKANCGFSMTEFISLVSSKTLHLLAQWKCYRRGSKDLSWLGNERIPDLNALMCVLVEHHVPNILLEPIESMPFCRLKDATNELVSIIEQLRWQPVFRACTQVSKFNETDSNELKVFWNEDCAQILRLFTSTKE